MLAALLQHHGEFELVVELLRQMFRKNDWFFMPDDRVDVLEENNPRHDGVGKARLGGFLVVLPKVARGVEEFLWNDRRRAVRRGSRELSPPFAKHSPEPFGQR